ncbi:MAG: hypothetical protein HN410_20740, partial [Prolixibacteraceae bacterium]|nr:hypothetical protein [Prolixibacteraceae bacterium]
QTTSFNSESGGSASPKYPVYKEHCSDINFIDAIPQYLIKVVSEGTSEFGEYITGYLDTAKIKISENRVKFYDSSICKYYLGDNFKTLSKGDTKRAIEKLSDTLHLPFHLANVTRIDFAQNLIMQYAEKTYYPYLGEAQYYNRLEQNNGLYYNNQKRQLLFYGKEYEQKVKKQSVPELYENQNVLRFEMRFKKQLRKQFNRPEIIASLLYDETFYFNLVKMWRNEYLEIQKINSKLIGMKATGSKKEFIENLALFSVLELGQSKVLHKVKEWQEQGLISKKQAYDLRVATKQLSRIKVDGKGNELITELDKKIKEVSYNW